MRPPRIPPMARTLVQTAVAAFDGIEFSHRSACPDCGGLLQGYDTKQKKFAVLNDGETNRIIKVRVRRFTCRECGRLCYADEPFYPGTRIGSLVLDLFFTLSVTMPRSRAARVIDAMGIVVNRTTWRNHPERRGPAIRTAEIFGMRLPFSVLSISSLAAAAGEGGGITGAEALTACGLPPAYRASPDRFPAGEKGNERDNEEKHEEPQADRS